MNENTNVTYTAKAIQSVLETLDGLEIKGAHNAGLLYGAVQILSSQGHVEEDSEKSEEEK